MTWKIIIPRTEAPVLREAYSSRNIVFTNGCFDILHVGHVRYLAAAKRLGDILVVGLNSDVSVRELKGPSRPINSQDDRAEVLASVAVVDHVIIFEEMRATNLILELCPDVYVKGGDYTIETLDASEREALQRVGAEIHILPLTPDKSTTRLIEAIKA